MKIILQYDPCFGDFSGCDPDALISVLFHDIDRGSKPDIIMWEIHRLLPSECECNNTSPYNSFAERNIDMMKRVIDETHKRGIEAYMHYRISEVDDVERRGIKNDVKAAHPDWVITTWRESGMWNLAAEGLRSFKLDYLGGILKKYSFDGICVDFLRHLPCLPIGEQWEHRECVTEFMSGIRAVTDSLSHRCKVGAKIPENLRACRVDGFDAETWMKDGIADFLVCGSRSLNPDITAFKFAAEGTETEIFACHDTWHSSDASHWREDAFYRGVFASWMKQGADGIVGFNYTAAPANVLASVLTEEARQKNGQWASENWTTRRITDFFAQTDGAKDDSQSRIFPMERRGGYPYGTGAGGTNCFAYLPLQMFAGVQYTLKAYTANPRGLKLRILVTAATPKLKLYVKAGKMPLTEIGRDTEFVDKQIFYPNPQGSSGARYCFAPDPKPLCELWFSIPDGCADGFFDLTLTADETVNAERVEIFAEGK